MVYQSFAQLVAAGSAAPRHVRMAVAAANDMHTLAACLRARDEGIAEPVLFGVRQTIRSLLDEMGAAFPDSDIYDVPDPAQAAASAVRCIREGGAHILMKGALDTSVFLKAVVDKEAGLNRGGVMSHFTAFEVPTYHKLLVPVDGGMVPYPTLAQKKAIIENTVGVLHALGYECPKVGVVTCVEKVNPKMPETVEARALMEQNSAGLITGCIVEGPISYDCAVSKEIADQKGFVSPVAGDVDILLAPDIHTGNIMGKMLLCSCNAKMAGFVAGASCPVVMTSRGATAEEKYLSIVLSSAAAMPGRA